mgnify:FL=1
MVDFLISHANFKERILEIIQAMAGSESGQGGGLAAMLPFILIMSIVYFLMIRPNTKKQKEKQQMIQSLKKGDKVITIGGIHGTIAGIKQKGSILVLNLGKNVNITINRSSIAGLAGATNDDDTLSEGMNT